MKQDSVTVCEELCPERQQAITGEVSWSMHGAVTPAGSGPSWRSPRFVGVSKSDNHCKMGNNTDFTQTKGVQKPFISRQYCVDFPFENLIFPRNL